MAVYPPSSAAREYFTEAFGTTFMAQLHDFVSRVLISGPALYNPFLFPTNSPRCRYICFIKLPAKGASLYEAFKAVLNSIRGFNIQHPEQPIRTLLLQKLDLLPKDTEAFGARELALAYRCARSIFFFFPFVSLLEEDFPFSPLIAIFSPPVPWYCGNFTRCSTLYSDQEKQ